MNNNSNEVREILARLREPFPAHLHHERDLPGGGKWFFIKWQDIKDRLDEVCPDWQVEYGTPVYLDKYCVVSCTLTIAGIKRQALGNAEIEVLSRSGKDMSRGTPVERSLADAFKNAAEAFGVAAYLDEQSEDKRKFTIRYLQKQGDGRGVQVARDNGMIPGNLPTAEQKRDRARAEQADLEARRTTATATAITEPQRKRLWAIAKTEGGFTDAGFKRLVEGCGFASSTQITTNKYNEICDRAKDPSQAAIYNQEPEDAIAS